MNRRAINLDGPATGDEVPCARPGLPADGGKGRNAIRGPDLCRPAGLASA